MTCVWYWAPGNLCLKLLIWRWWSSYVCCSMSGSYVKVLQVHSLNIDRTGKTMRWNKLRQSQGNSKAIHWVGTKKNKSLVLFFLEARNNRREFCFHIWYLIISVVLTEQSHLRTWSKLRGGTWTPSLLAYWTEHFISCPIPLTVIISSDE